MRAIQVTKWEETPKFTANAAAAPAPSADQIQVNVVAVGLPQLVRSQAAGTHYSVRDAKLPYTPGMDGVGFTSDNHNLVYFMSTTGGGMAEQVTIGKNAAIPIPVDETASEEKQREVGIKVAALVNPGMSSWMALQARAKVQTEYEMGQYNVLILGATTTSGKMAAVIARHLGAAKIFGAARNGDQLNEMKTSGAIDEAIVIDKEDPSKTNFSILSKERVHVVLDYIWGPTALACMTALPSSPSKADDLGVQWVHIGTVGRIMELSLPGPLLRSKNITLTGAGPGSWSLGRLAREMPALIGEIGKNFDDYVKAFGVAQRRLEDAEVAWASKEERTVFVV